MKVFGIILGAAAILFLVSSMLLTSDREGLRKETGDYESNNIG